VNSVHVRSTCSFRVLTPACLLNFIHYSDMYRSTYIDINESICIYISIEMCTFRDISIYIFEMSILVYRDTSVYRHIDGDID
jgi:hypothetical protein